MGSIQRIGGAALVAGIVVGCTALTGADRLEAVADGEVATDNPDARPPTDGPAPVQDASASPDPELPPGPTGWGFRRPITLANDTAGTLTSHAVLVALPGTFAYDKLKPDGADLRFSRASNHGDDLPYFIEQWSPNGTSFVWVLVPSVPTGASMFHMFYGNPGAAAAQSFQATFPRALQTEGAGNGSFTATGNIDVDWFELRAGDTLTLPLGSPLSITARRIVIAGTIDGNGRGHAGGTDQASSGGKGPGGGSASSGSGSGGGGHGGAGGRGGSDNETGGAGGQANGSDSDALVEMGSGGASAASASGLRSGGSGGGGIGLFGWRTTVSGTITVNGSDGAGGGGQNAGGGAGGGLVVAACWLELGGARLSASGGSGGPCANSGNDGGGGGGGGRIKLHARASGTYAAPQSTNVNGGSGGAGASTTAPGEPGGVGTLKTNTQSSIVTGVEAVLGAETIGR